MRYVRDSKTAPSAVATSHACRTAMRLRFRLFSSTSCPVGGSVGTGLPSNVANATVNKHTSDLHTVKLHSGSPSGTEVASFTRPSSIAGGNAVLEYTPATAVSLDANTTKDRC